MATLKLKKMPKKPKSTASLDTLKAYDKKCSEIAKENSKRKTEEVQRKKLYSKISSTKR